MRTTEAQREYYQSLLNFTESTLRATSRESENAVVIAGKLLDGISEDIARVSSMSKDTVDALTSVRTIIKSHGSVRSTLEENKISTLVTALKKINQEHEDISDVIMPLVTSLQFQDRVRQQMENTVKMLRVWLDYREENEPISKEDLGGFGQLLAAEVTTGEELQVLAKVFPGSTNAPDANSTDDIFL
jgi:hypothetical protein